MKAKMLGAMLAGIACLAGTSVALADNPMNRCDLVALSGSGTRLESGAIVGSETLTIIATGEQIPVTFTAAPLA